MNNPILREALTHGRSGKSASKQKQTESENEHSGNVMKRFVIERDIPSIGLADAAGLQGGSAQSCAIIEAMRGEGTQIEWEHSYVTADKTFCIYRAEDESVIRDHAERGGMPATIITEISAEIGPQTATG